MSRNGFTLLELLVALAVFSIAALALLRLDAVAVATAADLGERQGTMLVAENEAALLATDPVDPPLGASTRNVTNGGRSFVVTRLVLRTPDPRLLRIDLVATHDTGGGRAAVTMIRRVR